MNVLSKLLCCLPSTDLVSEKRGEAHHGYQPYQDAPSTDEVASDMVNSMLAATDKAVLQAQLRSSISAYGWCENLAAAILLALRKAIQLGVEMGPIMRDAIKRAKEALAKIPEWAGEHPVEAEIILTLLAIGVMALLMPWALAWLGFAEEGIIAGSWAARWQAAFRGFVPKGSLFSYLQSLGTKIGRLWRP